jgi:hypothetical protein
MIDHIIVSDVSVKSSDVSAIMRSNSDVIQALMRNFVRREELCSEAFKSHYVNLYSTLMDESGFAEFVYQTAWEQTSITYLVAGLESLKADAHIDLLAKFTERLSTHGADGVACLYDNDHPQNQEMRDFLNEFMPEFRALNEAQNLMVLNAQWLKQHPQLVVMSDTDIKRQIAVSSKAVPNRLQRIAESLAKEPRHLKLIRLLCDSANLDFIDLSLDERVPPVVDSQASIWHFDTVQGAYYLADSPSEAAIFDSDSHAKAASMQVEDVQMAPGNPKTLHEKVTQ